MKVAIGILIGIILLGIFTPRHYRPIAIPILLTLWLPIACVVLATLINFPGIFQILIFGSALWAAIDSSQIQLKRYKSGISYGPVVVFLCFVFLWIVAFPWYLIVRNKIKAGTAILKDEVPKNAA